jgi:predicted deacylase
MNYIILILLLIIIVIVLYYKTTINNICYKEPEYFEYIGKEKGPTILIIGATHGNEPAGYYGIKEFMNKLNRQEYTLKKGKIIFIPSVNYCGLQLNSRNHNIVGDINRLYRDRENNNIINKLIINFSKTSDFIIDFHEGVDYANKSDETLGSTITPAETEKSLEVANIVINNLNKIIDIEYKKFKINHNKKISGTFREFADINKLNYILIETTGQRNVQPINIRVQQCVNIITSVLENYNIINKNFIL